MLTTRRAFCGVTRMELNDAFAINGVLFGTGHRPIFLLDVAFEGTSWSKLAQLVADHRFCDVNRNMLTSIMHRNGVADHRRGDHRATRPCLNDILGALRILFIHLLFKVMIHEWTFLQATCHCCCSLSALVAWTATDD